MSVKRLRNRRTSSLTNLPSSSAFVKAASSPISRFPAYRITSFPAHQSLIRMGFCVPVSGKHIVIGDDVIFIR